MEHAPRNRPNYALQPLYTPIETKLPLFVHGFVPGDSPKHSILNSSFVSLGSASWAVNVAEVSTTCTSAVLKTEGGSGYL